jgi:hypothetical protein
MTVRHGVFGEPHLQGARQRPRRVLDEVREAVERQDILPVPQNLRIGRFDGSTRSTVHDPNSEFPQPDHLDRPRRTHYDRHLES